MLLFFVYILYFVKRNDHFLELRYISAVIIVIIIIIILTPACRAIIGVQPRM